MKHTVYLCGPITVCKTLDEAVSWRQYVAERLHPTIDALSPMRNKNSLSSFEDDEPNGLVMSSMKSITTRDRFDTCRCSVLLSNLTDQTTTVSIGSMIELGWADANRVPIVMVMATDNIHYHPIVRTISGWIVPTLDEAIEVVNNILVPGV